MNPSRRVLVAVAIKVAALVLLGAAVAWPDLGGLKAKGLGVRAVSYPLGLAALPALWWLARQVRARTRAISWVADSCCSLPILVDLLGNRAGLFDRIWWWDDAMHLAMHGLLTAGILLQFGWPGERGASRGQLMVAAAAFAGVSGLAWELGEYAAFMRFGVELSGAYRDTLGDLALGMLGSLAAAALLGWTGVGGSRTGLDLVGCPDDLVSAARIEAHRRSGLRAGLPAGPREPPAAGAAGRRAVQRPGL